MTRDIITIVIVTLTPGLMFSWDTGDQMLFTWPYHILYKGFRYGKRK